MQPRSLNKTRGQNSPQGTHRNSIIEMSRSKNRKAENPSVHMRT